MQKDLVKKITKFHDDDEHEKIVELVLAIPEKERDFEAIGFMARAYNNLENYKEAEKLLLPLENEGKDDFKWNFRLGYALFYLDKTKKAKELFEKALELDPEDEDTQNFVRWCKNDIFREKVEKKFEKAVVQMELGKQVEKTLPERINNFWNWFTENENKIAEIAEHKGGTDREDIIKFISEGVDPLSDDNEVFFNIGGDHEFTFTPEGESYLFFILPRIVAAMPEKLKNKWNVFPCSQGTNGSSFGLEMADISVSADEIFVSAGYDEDSNKYNIEFYCDKFKDMEENQYYHFFFTMFDITVGDTITHYYIGNVSSIDEKSKNMMPLNTLQKYIEDDFAKHGKKLSDDSYTSYGFNPDDSGKLRYDIITGITTYKELINDYYNGKTDEFDKLFACGAKAMFLVFPTMTKPTLKEVLNFRYDLEEKIQENVFGEAKSGKETGLVLGGALGASCAYVDMLVYDEKSFYTKLKTFLSGFDCDFYLSEFKPKSELIKIK